MKIELLKPVNEFFEQIKVNETFVYAGSPYIRVKHTEQALQSISGKKVAVIAGGGLAVNLSNGFITLIQDATVVTKTNFWLKETK